MRLQLNDIPSAFGFSFDIIADESGVQINVHHYSSMINRLQVEPFLGGTEGNLSQGVNVKLWEIDKWSAGEPAQVLPIVELFDRDNTD